MERGNRVYFISPDKAASWSSLASSSLASSLAIQRNSFTWNFNVTVIWNHEHSLALG